MTAPWGDRGEEMERRDLAVARVVEAAPGPPHTARERVVGWVVAAVLKLSSRRGAHDADGVREARQALGNATQLAADAAAGRLEGASLEGDIKRAEIMEKFAAARLANAQATKIEEDVAWERVERALTMASMLGASVQVVKLANGTPAIVVGDGILTSPLVLRSDVERSERTFHLGDSSVGNNGEA